MKTVGIVTLGCRVNQYESVALSEALQKKGFAIAGGDGVCDVYLVNTCAVTSESQRQCRQTVRRLASKAPTAVLGCAAQAAAEEFTSMEGVFYVGGCGDKMAVVDAIEQQLTAVHVTEMQNVPFELMSVAGESGLFSTCRAYLKIQDGCNGRCTYCIIPSLRGPSRSRGTDEIIGEARRLVGAGYRELVLTGIETSAFNSCRLEDLIVRLGDLEGDGLARVRLGSLSSGTLRAPFLEKVAGVSNFMPHVHLSLQSGSDRILELMKRPDRRAQFEERVALLREFLPRVRISADLITGFPTETEEDYLQTESLVHALDLLHVHAFPYSERPGTPAAEMPGSVPKEVRKERCLRLNHASDEQKQRIFSEFVGKTVRVLVEKVKNGEAIGHSEEFLECKVAGKPFVVGEIVSATVTAQDGKVLHAKI